MPPHHNLWGDLLLPSWGSWHGKLQVNSGTKGISLQESIHPALQVAELGSMSTGYLTPGPITADC